MIALVMPCSFFFFFNDTATTEIYTLSLHDALPISRHDPHRLGAAHRRQYGRWRRLVLLRGGAGRHLRHGGVVGDRKSTRLNSSHSQISYAVFCLKKKKKHTKSILHSLSTSM